MKYAIHHGILRRFETHRDSAGWSTFKDEDDLCIYGIQTELIATSTEEARQLYRAYCKYCVKSNFRSMINHFTWTWRWIQSCVQPLYK